MDQPNPQPITQSNSIQPTTNLRAQDRQFHYISQSVKVYQVLLSYQYISLSGITSAVTSFRIFGNVSDPRPNPTHGQLWFIGKNTCKWNCYFWLRIESTGRPASFYYRPVILRVECTDYRNWGGHSGPEVLFKTCVAMKFVNDDDDDRRRSSTLKVGFHIFDKCCNSNIRRLEGHHGRKSRQNHGPLSNWGNESIRWPSEFLKFSLSLCSWSAFGRGHPGNVRHLV